MCKCVFHGIRLLRLIERLVVGRQPIFCGASDINARKTAQSIMTFFITLDMAPTALILLLFWKKEAISEKIFVTLHMVWSILYSLFTTTKIQINSVKTEASNPFLCKNIKQFYFRNLSCLSMQGHYLPRLNVLSRWISTSFSLYATSFQLRCKVTHFSRKTSRIRNFL